MKALILLLPLIAVHLNLTAQGTFQNLDFEQAILKPRDNALAPWEMDPASALPGWLATIAGRPVPYVYSDGISLGGSTVALHDNNSLSPVVGKFTLYMYHGPPYGLPSISQTGFVPEDSKSLRFLGSSTGVTLAGNSLELFPLGSGENGFAIWGADITRLAGQTAELRFSGSGIIDNIQFSPLEVPEPTVGTLLFLAAGLVLVRRHRTRAEWRGRRLMG